MKIGKCPHCGASIREFRHALNNPLVHSLWVLSSRGGTDNIAKMGLNSNQRNNFQKLKYWDLVEKTEGENGEHIAGVWSITPKGVSFLSGAIKVPIAVVTYRNRRVRYDGPRVSIKYEFTKKYQQAKDFAVKATEKGVIEDYQEKLNFGRN